PPRPVVREPQVERAELEIRFRLGKLLLQLDPTSHLAGTLRRQQPRRCQAMPVLRTRRLVEPFGHPLALLPIGFRVVLTQPQAGGGAPDFGLVTWRPPLEHLGQMAGGRVPES